MDCPQFQHELSLSNQSHLEHYAYGFMNNMLYDEFRAHDKSFTIVPQSGQVDVLADFVIKKDNSIYAIVETKSLAGKN